MRRLMDFNTENLIETRILNQNRPQIRILHNISYRRRVWSLVVLWSGNDITELIAPISHIIYMTITHGIVVKTQNQNPDSRKPLFCRTKYSLLNYVSIRNNIPANRYQIRSVNYNNTIPATTKPLINSQDKLICLFTAQLFNSRPI